MLQKIEEFFFHNFKTIFFHARKYLFESTSTDLGLNKYMAYLLFYLNNNGNYENEVIFSFLKKKKQNTRKFIFFKDNVDKISYSRRRIITIYILTFLCCFFFFFFSKKVMITSFIKKIQSEQNMV